ncbi:MAG: Transposase [Parcubacteria group bacterium GW2011_GWA2_42_14]|nr:MAG: Transposase [Parcubacteria group bacterium GW2011_GWA2_42_14]
MEEFNTTEPIGSIFENSFRKRTQLGNPVSKLKVKEGKPLVSFVAYCLNPNHYHFVLCQLVDRGIEKFMHKLGLGYTNHFNRKNRRSGVLFQGPFKGVHIDSNNYLLYVSAYVNLNNRVHKLGNGVSKSSWDEYISGRDGVCDKNIILEQFKNTSEYRDFSRDALKIMLERKEMEHLLIEN